MSAAQRFVANGRAWEFSSWSDGGAIAHDVAIPATDLALVARYRDAGPVLTTVGGFGPGPDKLGPRVVLSSAKRRRLTGTVTDPGGVAGVKVAVRARKRLGGCRWWNAKAGRLARKPATCAKPRWIKAALKQAGAGKWTWTVALNGRLGRGRYAVALRATDGAGNRSTGSQALRFTK